jgi:hypothetical protein
VDIGTKNSKDITLHMDKSTIDALLSKIPGSKRAAHGVIITGKDGASFYLQESFSTKDVEELTQDELFFYAFCSKKEILRLRELRGAHDYLLRIRANAIVDSPRAVRVMRARKKNFEQNGRQWTLSQYYHVKDHYQKSYISYLSRTNAKLLKGIPSGLAYIPDVNAVCIRSLAGDVVMASESLEYFYYFMSIAFYGEALDIHSIDREHALLIAVRIMSGAEALDFDIDPRASLPPKAERKIMDLVRYQMQFTFGHEYAHLLCNHLSSPQNYGSETPHKITDALLKKHHIYNHILEHEADLYALRNIQHDQKAHLGVSQGAFSVFLYSHFLVEVQKEFGVRKPSVSETHPAPLNRLQKLLQGLGKKSPVSKDELADHLSVLDEMKKNFISQLKNSSDDILTSYGSVYLPNYKPKLQQDRYDF